MQLNINRILNIISKYEYISFDIFDTLIKRNVAKPTDVFTLVENEYNKLNDCKINDFHILRITAEQKARARSNKEDITFDDIYQELKNISKYNEETIDILKNLELQIEFTVCQKNDALFSVYNYCLEKGKKIIIISDMYLNQDILEKILSSNGYTGFERLFVSSNIGLLKSTGSIYKYVLHELGVKPDRVVHIGDAKRGDFLRPRLKGIRSILIPHKVNRLDYYNGESLGEERFMYDTLSAFINNNVPQDENKYFKIGYEILGPILLGFSKWLQDQLEDEDITKVFFLAREGLLMKKAFDIIKGSKISTEYIYVSRRSIFVPLIHQCSTLEELLKVIRVPRIESIKGFMTRCGLEVDAYRNLLAKYKYTDNTIIQSVDSFNDFFNEIKNDIYENSLNEYINLCGYLKENSMNGKIAVVDIGWHGSMQSSLTRIINQIGLSVNIKGYYLGLTANTNDVSNKAGFAFNAGDNRNNEFKIMSGASLVETLFLAQHGTTIKYENRNGTYYPVTDISEYTENEVNHIVSLQNGGLQFVNDLFQSKMLDKIELSANVSICNCNRLVTQPTKRDIDMFSNISFINFGLGNITPTKGLFYYIFRLKKLYKDFLDCGWKIAFLKKLLVIPLPYFKIYCLLKKRM